MASLNVGMAGRLPAERSFGAKTFRVAGLSGQACCRASRGRGRLTDLLIHALS